MLVAENGQAALQLLLEDSELQAAFAEVKNLQGLLPICGDCKRVRDDKNYREQVEGYVEQHADARFSHGICPDCYTKTLEPELRRLEEGRGP